MTFISLSDGVWSQFTSERPGRCGWHLMPVGIYITTGHEVYSLYIGGGTGQTSQAQH